MLSPINLDSAEFKLLKLISFINNLINEIKMEKKTPVAAPVEAAPAKKDKNVNPLLKNGVTNKDVRDFMNKKYFRSSALCFFISRQMARFP
jgi:hypothetical protein